MYIRVQGTHFVHVFRILSRDSLLKSCGSIIRMADLSLDFLFVTFFLLLDKFLSLLKFNKHNINLR